MIFQATVELPEDPLLPQMIFVLPSGISQVQVKVSNFPSVPRGPHLRDLDEGHPQIRDEFPGFHGSLRPHFVRAVQQLIHFQLKGVASALELQPDLLKPAAACDSFRRWSRKL